MKQLSFFASIAIYFVAASCGNSTHDEAKQVAEQISETSKQNSPGTVATNESGYYMKAMIDGKAWTASHMMPDEEVRSSYLRVHGENGGDYMNFQLWKRVVDVGKKIAFSEDLAANLSLEESDGFWGGRTGEVQITRMDGKWVEGNFAFTATSTGRPGKTINVTDGFFRVPLETAVQ